MKAHNITRITSNVPVFKHAVDKEIDSDTGCGWMRFETDRPRALGAIKHVARHIGKLFTNVDEAVEHKLIYAWLLYITGVSNVYEFRITNEGAIVALFS